ncbi:MAG: hypothetical protein GEV05_16560 [Betaproteobacteria bacterium]|nr:hypothetical protein [Betaproteobacteria bacterium]
MLGARRSSAKLSDTSRAHRRAVLAGGRVGCHRTHRRTEAFGAAATERHRRQPSRRRRHPRQRACHEVAGRRLHAAACGTRPDRRRAVYVSESGLCAGQGSRYGHARRYLSLYPGRASTRSGAQCAGADRLGQGEPGKAQHGLGRRRRRAAHRGRALQQHMAHTKMTHIPYKGTGPATIDLIGGHADLGFLDPAVLPQVKAGKLRALGVSSKKRYEPHPEIPPIHESGLPGYDWDTWYALFAPAGTPANVVARINEAMGQALSNPDVRQKLLAAGLVGGHSSPEDLRRSVEQDTKMLARLIKEANIKLR